MEKRSVTICRILLLPAALALAAALLSLLPKAHADQPAIKAYSMVTQDGKRLIARQAGPNSRLELVPTNALPKDLPPPRPWKLYVVKATQTDIGLHNGQYIQRAGTIKRIEDAMRLIDSDQRPDHDPAAYRYVLEGVWFWENYPMDRGEPAAWRVLTNYLARGRLDIACGCAGNHTHVMGPQELERSILTRHRLKEKWGVPTQTLILADNPGMSWSIVTPYARAGVRNIIFAPNQWNPIPSAHRTPDHTIPGAVWNPDARGGGNYIDISYNSRRPMVFYWESPDSATNILVWCSTMYDRGLARAGITPYGGNLPDVERRMPVFLDILERKYPYDIWLACNYCDDEPANTSFADFAAEWNAKWAIPQFVTVGRLDQPFDHLRRRFAHAIPTVRGEFASGWLQHVASAPELLADKLEAERNLTAAEQVWRADAQRDPELGREIDRAWWSLVLNDEHSYGTSGYQGRRVFETWMQHRDWIEYASNVAARVSGVYGLQPPSPGARRLLAPGVSENRFYRIVLDARGEIESIFDKELSRELLSAPANRFFYTRDNHRSWADESLLGARIVRKVYLAEEEKRIDVEDTFEHARDLYNTRRYRRFGYLAFPFSVPQGEFFAQLGGGETIDPYRDQSGYATDAFVAVREWCAVENETFGVALRQMDSMLVEFGEIHPDKTCFSGRPPKDRTGIYPFLFTDWLQMHQPDGDSMNFRFRFSIVSYPKHRRPWTATRHSQAPNTLTARHFATPDRTAWTGLSCRPRASHGEKDGQLYLLWSADLSPDFSHYELWRDGGILSCVTNEALCGIPYRVARYEDLGLSSHSRHTYRYRKVMKDGSRSDWSQSFSAVTRQTASHEALESEGLRCEIARRGAAVTEWSPPGCRTIIGAPENPGTSNRPPVTVLAVSWPWLREPPEPGLPHYGLTHAANWKLEEKIGKDTLRWSLASTPETLKLWPHPFRLDYIVKAIDRTLELSLTATNTGTTPFRADCGFLPIIRPDDAPRQTTANQLQTFRIAPPTPPLAPYPAKPDNRLHRYTPTLVPQGTDAYLDCTPGASGQPARTPPENLIHVGTCTSQPYELQPGQSTNHTFRIELLAP